MRKNQVELIIVATLMPRLDTRDRVETDSVEVGLDASLDRSRRGQAGSWMKIDFGKFRFGLSPGLGTFLNFIDCNII